jgi:shikimate kinase
MECDGKIPTPALPGDVAEIGADARAEIGADARAEIRADTGAGTGAGVDGGLDRASARAGVDAMVRAAAAQPITLVGLMGAGKTTIGRRLAARLHLPFVDADAEIETASGLTVAEIFERFGEAHFRDGERRVIARLIDGNPKVIATGGGAFIQPDTRALILARTIAIWLDADVATLVERVRRRGTRPLLTGKDPGEVLRALAAARNPIYAEAPVRIGSRAGPHSETVDAIVAALVAANRTATS